jgi:hypothetical protein
VCTAPPAQAAFAFIFRWVIGGAVTAGAYDAVSGATTVYYTTPTNFTGSVGVPFTNNVAITNNGGDAGAFFVLTNSSGISAALSAGQSTTVCMPAGLTFKVYDGNNGGSPKPIYGAMYGTPTTAVSNYRVHVLAGYTGQTPAETNIFFTFLTAQPPTITNQPVSVTNVAGGNATFDVTAGGAPPLSYRWRYFATNSISASTSRSLNLTNIRLSHAGDYSVVITNSAGAVTSAVAKLVVSVPTGPLINGAASVNNQFRFSFTPVVGLTNSVETNSGPAGGIWNALTNIPPPSSSAMISITNPITGPAGYYRVRIQP